MPTSNTLLHTDSKDSTSTTAGSSTGSRLIPRTLWGTLVSAIRKKLILRALVSRVLGPGDIPGSSVDIPLQQPETMNVYRVAEGAVIPLDAEEYSGFNLKPIKYGVRVLITREMEEDSLFGVMDMNVETAGYEMADNEEALIVAQLDAAATASGNTVANSNATLPISDITQGMQQIEAANFTPSHIIVGVEVANDLRNIDSFNEADKTGGPSAANGQRLIGSIFGMKVLVSNNVSSVLAYIIDVNHALIGAEKRPVTIERFFDASRDTNFAAVTQRIAYRYLRDEATSEITTT